MNVKKKIKALREEIEYLRKWEIYQINKREDLTELQKRYEKASISVLARAEELNW